MRAMNSCLVLLVIIYACNHDVHGYPSGAPQKACVEMKPLHYGTAAQSTPPPFEITLFQQNYRPNENITVILSAPCSTEQFGGFLLEARRADVRLDRNELLGTFDTPATTQHAFCGNGRQAVTHVDSTPKSTLVFQWTAPVQPVGHIVFAVTFASSKSTYWVKVYSSVVREANNNTEPDIGSEAYPTLSTCSVVVTQPPLPTLSPDPGCRGIKTCSSDCTNQQCGYIVSWTKSSSDPKGVVFELSTIVDRSTNRWMAIGFSSDDQMGEDKVVECVSFNNVVKVYPSYNTITPRLENRRNEDPNDSDGIKKIDASIVDGIFRCSFLVVTDQFSYINLSTPWHLMFASGATATFRDFKLQHSVAPGSLPPVTPEKINFMGGMTPPIVGNTTVLNTGSTQSTVPVTTPVPVLPSVNVRCTRTSIAVRIPKYSVPQGEYKLEDPGCRVNSYRNEIGTRFKVNECGTSKDITSEYVFYRNYLTNQQTRESYKIECRFRRARKVVIRTKFFYTNIHLQTRSSSSMGINVSVDIYKSSQFIHSVYGVNGRYAVDRETGIFVKLSVNQTKNDNLQVFPRYCRAELSPKPNPRWKRLIRNGCATDGSVVVYNGRNGDFRFSFHPLVNQTRKVVCSVLLCDAGSTCGRRCVTKRNKRSVNAGYVESK